MLELLLLHTFNNTCIVTQSYKKYGFIFCCRFTVNSQLYVFIDIPVAKQYIREINRSAVVKCSGPE